MRLLATTPEANLARLPIAFDLRAISLAEGMRAALSIAAIVAADQWAHWPPLLEAALGALLTCLCDSGGPIRRRIPALAAFTAVGSAFLVAFGLLRGAGLPFALPLACLGIFACSFARVWGQSALQVGNLLIVVLILSLDEARPLPDLSVSACVFAAGCVWATVLTMVIWRIHPYRPARRAVSESYRAVARLVGDLRVLVTADAGPAEWEAHARGHRRAVRDTIELARTAVQDTVRVRGARSERGWQALLRIEAIDQIFGAMIALSDLLEADRDPALTQAAASLLRLLRPLLTVVAEAIAAEDPAAPPARNAARLAQIGPAIDKIAAAGSVPALNAIVDALVQRLRVVAAVTLPQGWTPAAAGDLPAPPSWRQRFVRPVQANLDWNSAIFRHALRAMVLALPALGFTLLWSGRYQHWLTITLILTMQPFYAMTWQRALERISGTVLGGLVAAVISLVCTTPLSIAAALFPLAVLAFTLRTVNFAAFMALLTPLVVLLTEFSRPGTGELLIVGLRALYTVAGGLLAVLGCLLLWPSWEPDRLKRELRAAIDAHRAFAEAELDNLAGQGSDAAVHAARRAAGVASNNLETSISRALNEPRRRVKADLQSVMVVDAALRRMAGRLSSLQLDPKYRRGIDPAALTMWRDWISQALGALAAGAPLPAARPAIPAPAALQWIARPIEFMHGALARDRPDWSRQDDLGLSGRDWPH